MFRALHQAISARLQPEWPKIDGNTAVLWEPCSRSHGEIIPGYARLLLDLNYRVVVLMTPDRKTEGLFSRFEHPNLELTNLTQRQISRFVKTPAVRNAAVLFVSTAGKLPHNPDATVDLTAVFGPDIPQNLLMVEHDAKAQIDAGVWSSDAITLRGLDYQEQNSTVINPHDFGAVHITPKSQGKTIFLLVGAARAKRRNQNLVYDAAEKLVADGIVDFEIRLIGKKGRDPIPLPLESHVVELGRLDFKDMYREIEQSDFIVTAFQGDNPDHDAYKTVKTTGSFQLCYGFGKPCILQQEFATGTALNADNSLIYETDEQMYDAMQRAVTMSAQEYETLQGKLIAAARDLHHKSLKNMGKLIDA